MNPITGHLAVTTGEAKVAPPGPPHTFVGVAESLLPGMRVLMTSAEPTELPLAMLCAHALECILKAYLTRNGDDPRLEKDSDLRHSIKKLWDEAAVQGLKLPPTFPDWAHRLDTMHKKPFQLRYSKGVHGIVLPSPEPMVTELTDLLQQVKSQL